MAIPHLAPGELTNLLAMADPAARQTTTIFKTTRLEVIRLVLASGKQIPPHSVPAEAIIQCLTGQISFEARGKKQTLLPGAMLYLEGGDKHALEALEDSTLLVTILLSI
jgi:quercetin dioxygenase-like cupin family protein